MDKFFNLYSILFVIVIVVACFFRFYQLSSVPPSGSLDEVSIGWNAYSILLTGKGEYGKTLPVIMQAYDDFRPAGYLYMVIPFIKLFGLSVLAVRLPSAILSIITVVASFFLVKILLKGYKYEKWVSLTVMALFAISPFHIYISRIGHEVNPGLTFALLGVVFFLWGIRTPKKWLILLSGILWAGAFYTYQSEKVFIPLIVVALLGFFYREVWKNKKIIFVSLSVTFILSLPIVYASFQPGALLRLQGTSIFVEDQTPYKQAALKLAQAKEHHDLIGELVNNRRLVSISIFLENYHTHFDLKWWLGNDGLERFKAPGFGLAYPWELPLFILGIIFLWRLPIVLSLKILSVLWILIAFVAPGISTEAPHAMRSYNILPIPQLLESIGLIELFVLLGRIKGISKALQAILLVTTIVFIGISIVQYSFAYFVAFPHTESSQYQYALHTAMKYVLAHRKEYDHVVVSNQDQAYQSYMFYLYESKYDPTTYQKSGGTKSGGFLANHHIDNVEFVQLDKSMKLQLHTLYIGNISDVPDNVFIIQNFKGLAHRVKLVAFAAKP